MKINNELTLDIINIAGEKTIPKTKANNKTKPVRWWFDEIKSKCSYRNKMRTLFKKTNIQEYHTNYKIAKAEVGRFSIAAKQNSWRKFMVRLITEPLSTILQKHKTEITNKQKADLLSFSKNSSNENFPKIFSEMLSSKNILPFNNVTATKQESNETINYINL